MRKAWIMWTVIGLLVVGLLVPVAVARKRDISPNNPMARQTIDLWPLITAVREYIGADPIDTTIDPIGKDDGHLLYLLGFNTQALAQLWEYVSEKGEIVSLEDLATVSFFGSPRSLFKLLLVYTFPDEAELAEEDFFVVDQPDWWIAWPSGPLF